MDNYIDNFVNLSNNPTDSESSEEESENLNDMDIVEEDERIQKKEIKNDINNFQAIQKLQSMRYIKEDKICPHCDKIMYLKKFKCIDNYHWECRGVNPRKHYSSKSVKSDTIFSSSKKPLFFLLLVVENCFIEGYSLNRSLNEIASWKMETLSYSALLNFYKKIRARSD